MRKCRSDSSAAFDDLSAVMTEHRGLVNAELDRVLPPAEAPPGSIHEAVRHSIFSGGKRLRPILVLMSCELCGGDKALALPAACALEMIHTYSLIHDDLPAMDDDDLRRGKPTCHKAFGEATAILAGDALLTGAFELLARKSVNCAILVAEVAEAAGTAGMVGGQVADICSEHLPPDADLVKFIHERKTAALIRQAARSGAIIAGAEGRPLESVTDYGEKVGLAYQVTDDILDVEGTTQQLGKTAGKDAQSGKQTYPAAFGLEASRRKAAELADQAKQCLAPFGRKARTLCSLADFIIARGS